MVTGMGLIRDVNRPVFIGLCTWQFKLVFATDFVRISKMRSIVVATSRPLPGLSPGRLSTLK